jgi:hypothetical protein
MISGKHEMITGFKGLNSLGICRFDLHETKVLTSKKTSSSNKSQTFSASSGMQLRCQAMGLQDYGYRL